MGPQDIYRGLNADLLKQGIEGLHDMRYLARRIEEEKPRYLPASQPDDYLTLCQRGILSGAPSVARGNDGYAQNGSVTTPDHRKQPQYDPSEFAQNERERNQRTRSLYSPGASLYFLTGFHTP